VNSHRTTGCASASNHQKAAMTVQSGINASWNFCADRRDRAW